MAKTRTLYHSELTKACADGPVKVKVKSDVLKSQYKRDGKDSYYVTLYFDGEDRTYNCENNACRKALDGRKGDTIHITASGRDDDAEIVIEDDQDDAGETPRREERESEPEPRSSRQRETTERPPAAAHDPHKVVAHFKTRLARAANAYKLCLGAAYAVIGRGDAGHELSPADIKDIAGTLFIYMDRSGLVDDMPWKMPEPKAAEPPPKPKDEPPPKPKPAPAAEPDAPEDDIPF